MSLTRREFLKRLSLAAGVAAIGGLLKLDAKLVGINEKVAGVTAWDGHVGLVTMASSDNRDRLWITWNGERHYLKCHKIDTEIGQLTRAGVDSNGALWIQERRPDDYWPDEGIVWKIDREMEKTLPWSWDMEQGG